MRYGLLRFGSLLLFTSLLLPSVAFAQGRMGGGGRGQQPEVERVIPETYKLPGYRHGVGFFPQAYHPGVEYEAGRTLTFDRYHTAEVMYEWLHRWEQQYPNLVNVWEVDKSFEGRSILMAKSTRAKAEDVSSNVVWSYGHLTIPRHLRDIVITEYGIAELRSKRDKEVIAAILNITDSRFQNELLREAKQAGKIPQDYQIPDMFRNNFPERLEDDLKPCREKGLFSPFPFGTDFTKEELVIGKALRKLKEKMAVRKFPVPTFREAKKLVAVPEAAMPYLERLKLDKPATGREKMMQKMVVYALASEGKI